MVGEDLVISGGVFVGVLGVLKVIGIGAIRSFGGWIENALQDNRVDRFEVGQLFGTIVRTSLITGALYFGIEGIFGTDMTILGAGAGAFVTDFVVKKFSKKTLPIVPSKK